MKIQTVNQLISVFKDIATRHYQINGFGIGDSWEIGASEAKMHPVLWINPVTATMPETDYGYKTFEIDFEVRVFDLVNKDESNENDVLSDTIDIIKDIITEFKGHPYYVASELNIVNDISFEAFTEEFDEEVSGWLCEISLMTPILTTFCGLPMAEITGFEFPGSDCPTVNTLCPVFIDEIVGTYPIIVDAFGTTRTISIDTDALVDTYMISQDFNSGSDNILTTTLNNGTSFDTLIDNFNTITINGTINSNNPDTGIILNSFNTSTGGDLSQFVIEHISGGVTIRNDRDLPIILNPDGKTTIGAINSLGCAEITLAKDTIVSGEFVQHVSTTPTADACLIDNSISFHMDGSALAGQYKDNLGVVTPIEFGATVDKVSITDSNGVYTYYSTLATAYSNAVAGDVVKLHTDLEETGDVSITMINDVTLDLNGYTYTHSGNADVITYSGATASTFHVIKNGNITKTAGTGILFREAYGIAPTNHLLNVVFSNEVGKCINANGNFVCTGSKFYANDSGVQGNFFSTANARVDGGEYYNVHATGGNYTTADVYNTRGEAYGSGVGMQLNGSDAYFSKGYSVSGVGLAGSSSNVTDCYGFSDTGIGINVSGAGTTLRCIGISNTNKGISAAGGQLIDCSGICKGSQYGINLTNVVTHVINCYIESNSGSGLSASSHDVEIKNCVIKVNSGTGRGVYPNGFRFRMYNCVITVADPSADGIIVQQGDCYLAGNLIKGSTKGINFSSTGVNLWTATTDAQGNSAQL